MLTTPQINALRFLDPADSHGPQGEYRIAPRTKASLLRARLVNADCTALTERGTRVIRQYVEDTGNGPEALKAMFRGIFR